MLLFWILSKKITTAGVLLDQRHVKRAKVLHNLKYKHRHNNTLNNIFCQELLANFLKIANNSQK
jgi:hypothetical protein